jgi:hypothetical protein
MRNDIKNLLDGICDGPQDLPFAQVQQQVAGVCRQQPRWKETFCDYGIDAAITEYLTERKIST